ncbi:DCC1-like thiol-disulfide oxidoreductase family protein [Methylicorpusculum oleiharenae]|uniref:DCC1-like thiol-disulfide oxidoreductase family protein n=1 Tax=Methylicorpusculum oleiharenae TaxID=1338687 RepID=UPI002EDACDAB
MCRFDITGQDQRLRDLGFDSQKALSELHVRETNGRILSERDAYILLMNKVLLLKPVACLIVLPLIRPLLVQLYHRQVNRRLESTEASFDANLLLASPSRNPGQISIAVLAVATSSSALDYQLRR